VVAACKGVPVLVEVILETENQRMLNALMGACVGVLPARKVKHLPSSASSTSIFADSMLGGVYPSFSSLAPSPLLCAHPFLLSVFTSTPLIPVVSSSSTAILASQCL